MTDSYTIKRRENPFQFYASEFIGDIPNAEALLDLDAEVGALVYVINTGYTYIQAQIFFKGKEVYQYILE